MNTNETANNNATSITMDLENLQQEYSNLLIKYKQAVTNYISYLNIESQKPCINFSADSKNVDQKCYDYIWKKAGCKTTGVVNANTSWAQSQTLNGLIYDSFLWATLTDNTHRQGCYGTSTDYTTATQPDYKINNPPLTSIQGMAYTGTGSAGQSTATTLQECQADCASSSTCTGATFVSGKCNLRVGDSPIIPSSNDSYAIIPKGKQLLMSMNDLNNQLLNINKQISNKIQTGQPVYNKFQSQTDDKSRELLKNYKELEAERENIRKLLKEYETLDTTENENQIKITQNYYTYILLFILAIAVIFLLVKITSLGTSSTVPTVQYGGELNIKAYYILFVIIIMALGINFLFK